MVKLPFINALISKGRARRLLWTVFPVAALIASYLMLSAPRHVDSPIVVEEPVDPLAKDFFFMRNPEIRRDLLEQLTLHNIEYWVNEDDSIGFYVKNTREVDRIANESIAVWITSQ